jgi:hypothetical protein
MATLDTKCKKRMPASLLARFFVRPLTEPGRHNPAGARLTVRFETRACYRIAYELSTLT